MKLLPIDICLKLKVEKLCGHSVDKRRCRDYFLLGRFTLRNTFTVLHPILIMGS